MKRETYNKVLELVNKILVKHGKQPREKLSAGVPNSKLYCPISRTLLDGSFEMDNKVVITGSDYIVVDNQFQTAPNTPEAELVTLFTKEIDTQGPEVLVVSPIGQRTLDPETLLED